MTINILAFGIAKEILKGSHVSLFLDDEVTVESLKDVLTQRYPELKKLSSFMIAINGEYATAGIIHPGDEVAIIPPVSGG
jgi:molybdopterin converting factor subunit 1